MKSLQKKIDQAVQVGKRDIKDITLIAVSKKQPIEKIEKAIQAGHRVFGENRVQEAYDHFETLKAENKDIELHLIGPLQSNKVKDAVALFDVIHSVDRPKIAEKLSKAMKDLEKSIPCFIQVNTGREDQKSGIDVDDLDDFYHYCTKDCGLNIIGLMTIPPVDEVSGFHFALLKKKAEKLGLDCLSMGMSGDFESAIQFGSTHIRVGTAFFGNRQS